MKGIIFDVDGCLLDSMYIWDNLANRYLDTLGIAYESGLSEKMYTMTIEESGKYLQEHYLPNKEVKQIIHEVLSLIQSFYDTEAPLKPGVREFLERHRDIPKLVLTSNDRSLVEPAFKRLNISQYFNGMLTCPEEGVSKNGPEMYQKALSILNLNPEEVFYFDDSYYPLLAAKQVGIHIVGVHDASSEKDRDKIIEISEHFITDFTELL